VNSATPTMLVLQASLIFARVGSMAMLLPGFGEVSVPPMVRAGIATGLTIIIFSVVAPHLPAVPQAPFALGAALLGEVAIGLYLGWLIKVVAFALPMAGQIISYQIGLSSVILPDQQLGAETTLLSSAFGLAVPALIFGSGLFAFPIMALATSYHLMPPGGAIKASDIVRLALMFTQQEFIMALRLAAPFMVAGLIWQAGLAIMARLAPQIQIFFIAAPGQILGGLTLLSLTCMTLIALWEHGFSRMISYGLG
jgi:flagellar biosynthetic protein FliR